MSQGLDTTHFRCASCDEWKTVETIGTVMQGPRCPKCGKPMRQVTLEQAELNLFPRTSKD